MSGTTLKELFYPNDKSVALKKLKNLSWTNPANFPSIFCADFSQLIGVGSFCNHLFGSQPDL